MAAFEDDKAVFVAHVSSGTSAEIAVHTVAFLLVLQGYTTQKSSSRLFLKEYRGFMV